VSQKVASLVIALRLIIDYRMMPNSQLQPVKGKVYKIPSRKDNFGLSKADFLRYKENLIIGDDSFITKYMVHQLPETISFLQNKFSISREESYDCCMNTFLEFRTKMIHNKIQYGNLRFLFTRMCANNFIDAEKKKMKVQEAIKCFLGQKEDIPKNAEFFTRLESSIDNLNQEQQLLIREIYYSGKTMESIAEEQNLKYANLRKKKQRILTKLRTLFFQKDNK